MVSESGDSTASIKKRADDEAWSRMIGGLSSGGRCRRIPKLHSTFLMVNNAPSIGGISDTRLRKLLREGTLVEVGLDTYALQLGSAEIDPATRTIV